MDFEYTQGFSEIYESFRDAETVKELTTRVEESVGLIQRYYLGKRQVKTLETFGMRCFVNIEERSRKYAYVLKGNRVIIDD